jgi:hypothetical protein
MTLRLLHRRWSKHITVWKEYNVSSGHNPTGIKFFKFYVNG